MPKYLVAAFYKFVPLPAFEKLQAPVLEFCRRHDILGTILLAEEGINGTVCGLEPNMRKLLAYLSGLPEISGLEHKESWADEAPFHRIKVRLKKEIVTLGEPGVDPNKKVGEYIEPEDWNELISDPDVVVIDTRNDYEVSIGTFKGAINPETTSFREFPEWFRSKRELHNKPKIAMFCTGGIRCEKSTAFLKAEGFEDVFHLKGGILKYLETVPEEESLWDGECFVFDNRVSVGHGLRPGPYDLCHACRHPITEEDKKSPRYSPGVSCPRCHDQLSEEQVARFAERQRQIELSKQRGDKHIAADQRAQRLAKREARKAQIEASQSGETGAAPAGQP